MKSSKRAGIFPFTIDGVDKTNIAMPIEDADLGLWFGPQSQHLIRDEDKVIPLVADNDGGDIHVLVQHTTMKHHWCW